MEWFYWWIHTQRGPFLWQELGFVICINVDIVCVVFNLLNTNNEFKLKIL